MGLWVVTLNKSQLTALQTLIQRLPHTVNRFMLQVTERRFARATSDNSWMNLDATPDEAASHQRHPRLRTGTLSPLLSECDGPCGFTCHCLGFSLGFGPFTHRSQDLEARQNIMLDRLQWKCSACLLASAP